VTQEQVRAQLVTLYEEMYQHTKDRCDGCKGGASCCHSTICEMVAQESWFNWGVELTSTGHPKLPLMGATGCSAAPHIRPLCTVHVCGIQSHGGDPGDPVWTARYWERRNNLRDLELQLESVR
jgi:hypothetical protein